jgi:hypothetical protein
MINELSKNKGQEIFCKGPEPNAKNMFNNFIELYD